MKYFTLILISALLAIQSVSALDIFMRAKAPTNPALNYTGDSIDSDYNGSDGWFDISSFSFGVERPVPNGSQGAADASALPLGFIKRASAVSAALFTSCVTNFSWDEVEVVFVRSGEFSTDLVMRVELRQVTVSSITGAVANGDDSLEEEVRLSYGAQRLTFFSGGSGDQAVQTGQSVWSFVKNESSFEVE